MKFYADFCKNFTHTEDCAYKHLCALLACHIVDLLYQYCACVASCKFYLTYVQLSCATLYYMLTQSTTYL